MDAVLLSRLQFALTISFHFIFVSINIGLAWMLVIIELLGWRKKNGDVYIRIAKFFSKLFAVTFIFGTATGIVMEFQIGMNWARFSKFAGDVFGPMLAAEGLLAFFLESSFLGLYLFGRKRVPAGIHWFSILMVAAASTFSAFWIISANSWQQTPAGHVINSGRVELISFWDAIFNPSTIIRFLHTIDASLIVAAFFIAGISAHLILKNKKLDEAKKSLRLAIIPGLIFCLIQIIPLGHNHAQQVALTQPEKFAIYEGVYRTQSYAPMVLFGIPVNSQQELKWAIEIPGLLSWITFGDTSATITGIEDFPPDEIPPRIIPFAAFHLMVGLGMYFVPVMLFGTIQLYRDKLWNKRIFLKLLVWSVPLPVIAAQLGWIAAETGRQPWIIYRIMKTSEATSLSVSGSTVAGSILMFGLLYTFLGILYIYLVRREIR